MILSSKARYAVMAMADLAARGEDKPLTLADLAANQAIPLPFLEQIFGRLRKSGLVSSARGPGGGYTLARNASSISIADIIAATEENISMTRCDKHETGGCLKENTRCLTHDLWEGLERHIYDYLAKITLDSFHMEKSNAFYALTYPKQDNHLHYE